MKVDIEKMYAQGILERPPDEPDEPKKLWFMRPRYMIPYTVVMFGLCIVTYVFITLNMSIKVPPDKTATDSSTYAESMDSGAMVLHIDENLTVDLPVETPVVAESDEDDAVTEEIVAEAAEVDAEEEEPVDEFHTDLVMANTKSAINVRVEPSSDSEKAGVLYAGSGGTILEQLDGWTKIESGDLVGWVNDEYLLFDREAQDVADNVMTLVGTVEVGTLNVRSGPGTDYAIMGTTHEGDELNVIGFTYDNWAKIERNGESAYISANYMNVAYQVPTGETTDVIDKREAEERAVRIEALNSLAKVDNTKRNSTITAYASELNSVVTTTETYPIVLNTDGWIVAATEEQVNMLAAIIYCEAGNQSYEGKVAVGAVVLNRVVSDRFPNNIPDVIRAPSQFSPVGSGRFDRVYSSGSWSESCMQAALDALAGGNPVGGALFFKNPKIAGAHSGITIGDHVFW